MGTNKAQEQNGASRMPGPPRGLEGALVGLLLLAGGWVAWRFWSRPQVTGWVEWMFALLLVLASVVAHCRALPCQNVVLGSTLIAAMALGLETMAIWSGAGGLAYTERMGARLFGFVPWMMGLIWVSFVWLSRGVAQTLLWRKAGTRNYGLWVLGATVLLVVVLFAGANPAAEVKGYWEVRSGGSLAPLLVKALVAVMALVVITPVLVRKKPGVAPVAYGALFAWVGVNAVWLAAAVAARSWWTAALIVGQVMVVGGLVVRPSLRRNVR